MQNFLTLLFFILSVVSCFFTYLAFTNVGLYSRKPHLVISMLYCDAALILILFLLLSHKLTVVWATRNHKGSRLTLRLISLFSLISVVPSVLMTLFSAFFFHNGIDSWFNERNRTVLEESLNVADSYLEEQKQYALNDCITLSKTLEYHFNRVFPAEAFNDEHFLKQIGFLLDDLCGLKSINSAILLNENLGVVSFSRYSVGLHFLNISNEDIRNAHEKDAHILKINKDDSPPNIVVISCLKNQQDEYMYLIIEKKVDANILFRAKYAQTAYNEYNQLLSQRNSLEIGFIFMFLVVGILLLVTSIAAAIVYSWKIVKPISNLVDVSESIISGDAKARATEVSSYEEVSVLIKTFNQMMDQVQKQREDLVIMNRQLDERIKFSSSVLFGVSSGVIGIDNNSIYIWNSAAERLLGKNISFGEHICNLIPEIDSLISEVSAQNTFIEKEITYEKNNESLVLLIKIGNIEPANSSYSRFVITFDDVTQVINAQRRAAWTEAARRVAHEIKNPLTPIQLSAERIHRKYLSQISVDRETFENLVDVIIRQVEDIKRLINNFTSFAKLPDPVMKQCDLCKICTQAVFLMQNTTNDIDITLNSTEETCKISADERLLHQSIVNLIQNAINALNTVSKDGKKVVVTLSKLDEFMQISIEDNGPGLPKEKMDMLATPYFTLMPKGTGLGLVIVKKTIQEHRGSLTFGESAYGGAKIIITLPLN